MSDRIKGIQARRREIKKTALRKKDEVITGIIENMRRIRIQLDF